MYREESQLHSNQDVLSPRSDLNVVGVCGVMCSP